MTSQAASNIANFTVPGMDKAPARKAIDILEDRLASLIDLQLTGQCHQHVVAVLLVDDMQGVQGCRGEQGRQHGDRQCDLDLQ